MEKWTLDQALNWIKSNPNFSFSSKEDVENTASNINLIFSNLDDSGKLMLTESLAKACIDFNYDDGNIVKFLQGELDMDKNDIKSAVKEVLNEGDSTEIANLKSEIANRDATIASQSQEIETLTASLSEKDTLISASQNTITQLEEDKKVLASEKEAINTELASIKQEKRLNDRKSQLSESNIQFDTLTDDQKKLVETAEDTIFATMISLIPKVEVKDKKPDLVDASDKNKIIVDTNDEIKDKKDYSFIRKGSRVAARV